MSTNLKITNVFKEKKKSNKRLNLKSTEGLDSEDEKIIEFESHELKNKKIRPQYPKLKSTKDQKYNLLNLKVCESRNSDGIESKSTQAFSKRSAYIDTESKDNNNMEVEEENKSKVFELSEKTKSILHQIITKRKEQKQNKISNKENDSTLFDSSNKSKKNKLDLILLSKNKKVEPPKLSMRTIEIMKKLKEERKNRFDRPDNNDKSLRSDCSFTSMRFKYEELLSKPRELRLPIKYKKIFNIFLSLEQTICLNKIREKNQLNTFDNIRNNIENVTKHSFSMKELQQILYVVPHFYILKYINKNGKSTFNINDELNKDFDLVIDIPKDFNERMNKNYPDDFNFVSINYYDMNSDDFFPTYHPFNIKESNRRKEIFKNILNRIVNVYHKKYLERKNIKINFDPLVEKTWVHTFDPDVECGDIPVFEIPLPPNKSSVFQDIIMKNDIKNEIMKDALNMLNKQNDEKKNDNGKNNMIKNKYVSQKFLDKIRAKEKANNIINEINNYSLYHNSHKDMTMIYREVLIQVKTSLLVNNKSIQLDKISESILNSSKLIKDYICDESKISEIICKLCERYGNFISIKNHSSLGKVVVLENCNFEIPKNINIDKE